MSKFDSVIARKCPPACRIVDPPGGGHIHGDNPLKPLLKRCLKSVPPAASALRRDIKAALAGMP